jgi:hypothetical protein
MRASLRLPLLFLASAALLTSPSAAQPGPSALQLVALITGGLADGGKVLMGSLGIGTVTQTADGVYQVRFPGEDAPANFVYKFESDCIVTQETSMEGWPSSIGRYNFNVMDKIDVTAQQPLPGYEGVNFMLMEMKGLPSMAQMADGEGEMVDLPWAGASLATSLTADEVRNAALSLAMLCPMSEMR